MRVLPPGFLPLLDQALPLRCTVIVPTKGIKITGEGASDAFWIMW
jgi:hypothetical protein